MGSESHGLHSPSVCESAPRAFPPIATSVPNQKRKSPPLTTHPSGDTPMATKASTRMGFHAPPGRIQSTCYRRNGGYIPAHPAVARLARTGPPASPVHCRAVHSPWSVGPESSLPAACRLRCGQAPMCLVFLQRFFAENSDQFFQKTTNSDVFNARVVWTIPFARNDQSASRLETRSQGDFSGVIWSDNRNFHPRSPNAKDRRYHRLNNLSRRSRLPACKWVQYQTETQHNETKLDIPD